MSEPNVQYWVGAKFTLKEIATPANTLEIWVTNRPRLVNDATETIYHPIIVKVSELGVQAGIVLPEVTGGQIILDNRPGTWAGRQKFTDLLERYAIVDQPVAIYMDTTAGDSNNFSFAAGDMIWSGHVESIENQISGPENVVSINISVNEIPDTPACYVINTTSADFTATSSQSIGKTLPIIAGTALVNAFPKTDGGQIVAHGCSMADTFSLEDPSTGTYYVQDFNGVWQSLTGNWSDQGVTVTGQESLDTYAGLACTVTNTGSDDCPLVGITVSFHPGDPGGAVELDGVFVTAGVAAFDATGVLGDNITEGTVDLGDYETQNRDGGSADFGILFPLDPIIMPDPDLTYAVTLSCANWKTKTPSVNLASAVTAQRYYKSLAGTTTINTTDWIKDVSADGDDSFLLDFTVLAPNMIVATTESNEDGFRPFIMTFALNGDAADVTALTGTIDHFNSDVVATINGLCDDDSGTVSGNPNLVFTRLDQFLKALQYEWSGTAWADSGSWDFTTLATEYAAIYDTGNVRGRVPNGFLPGYVTKAELIEAICRDMATRVGINNSGKLFPWPWGYAYSVTKHIPAEDIIPEAWNIADPTSVVNRITVNYSKDVRGVNLYKNLGTDLDSFSASIDWGWDTNGLTRTLSTKSFQLYGNRPAESIDTNFIGDAVSAATLAQYLLATCAYPMTTAVFTVPFIEYKALKMFDTITFAHPEFPAYYGTHPDDVDPVLEGNAMTANLHRGYPFVRAQQYRGLIEGRFINMPDNGPPSIRLIVRVNTNYPADPT